MPYYPPAASAGTPGGSDTQVQFNDGGVFGGDSGMTFNKTTNSLTLLGNLTVNGGTVSVYELLMSNNRLYLTGSFLEMTSAAGFKWSSSGSEAWQAKDTGLMRNAAGVVEINNSVAGTYRDLILRNLIGTGYLTLDGTSVSSASGTLSLGGVVRTTIGANGAASALTANPLGYIDAYVGSTAVQIPYYTRGA